MQATHFEIIGYRLYVFKDGIPYDTLYFDRLEDVVNRYEFAVSKGYGVTAERVEKIVIE